VSQKQFDLIKWSFLLVAAVILAHVLVVLMSMAACLYYSDLIIEGKAKCDTDGRLTEVMAAALAAALAFAGGHISNYRSGGDRDKEP
jgi:hypothetical protein